MLKQRKIRYLHDVENRYTNVIEISHAQYANFTMKTLPLKI